MSEDNPTPAEQAVIDAKEAAVAEAKAKADATNATRSGKGTRLTVKSTKGRNTQVVTFEAFDKEQPDTCPKSLSEFMDMVKSMTGKDVLEADIVDSLIDGFNANAYSVASDPIAEYLDSSWTPAVQTQFKLVVRNYSNATGVSIEDAVALIKPGIVASQKK